MSLAPHSFTNGSVRKLFALPTITMIMTASITTIMIVTITTTIITVVIRIPVTVTLITIALARKYQEGPKKGTRLDGIFQHPYEEDNDRVC